MSKAAAVALLGWGRRAKQSRRFDPGLRASRPPGGPGGGAPGGLGLGSLAQRLARRSGVGAGDARKGLDRLAGEGRLRLGRRRAYRLENFGNWRLRIRGRPGRRRSRVVWQAHRDLARAAGLGADGRALGDGGEGMAALRRGEGWTRPRSAAFLGALRSAAAGDLRSRGAFHWPGLGRWRLSVRRPHGRRLRGRSVDVRGARVLRFLAEETWASAGSR